MEKEKLDLTDYLLRYPQKDFESLEDYQDRIDTNLFEDYRLSSDIRNKILNALFKTEGVL